MEDLEYRIASVGVGKVVGLGTVITVRDALPAWVTGCNISSRVCCSGRVIYGAFPCRLRECCTTYYWSTT